MATVTTESEFKDAIDNMDPQIIVANNISLSTVTNIAYTVTIKGNEPGVSLLGNVTTGTTRNVFRIAGNGDLTIEDISVDAEGKDMTVVQLRGGRFTMTDGCVIKGVTSATGRCPVIVGEPSYDLGGTFIMDGGLITENDVYYAVESYAGTVIMNNDALISSNNGAGVCSAAQINNADNRSTFIMTGNATISNNAGKQPGGGAIVVCSDFIMGVNEGDAPKITGNENPYYGGGLFIDEDSTFTMGYNAEISNNYAPLFAGGAAIEDTVFNMTGNASIKNNRTDGSAAGVLLSTELFDAAILMDENAEISGNICGDGNGGGIYIQQEAVLKIKGSASISGNKATEGGGIYIINTVPVSIGEDNSMPGIFNNEASANGGGIYIDEDGELNLSGQASIYGNSALAGAGIYKLGELNLSEAPKITDGLYFDDLIAGTGNRALLNNNGAAASQACHSFGEKVVSIKLASSKAGFAQYAGVRTDIALAGTYSDNVPKIAKTLSGAEIQLEASDYVSPPNVRLVIAEKTDACDDLCETDRVSWCLPQTFIPGHHCIISDDLTQILIDRETYTIKYYHLFGCDNPNPTEYDVGTEFPIVLLPPSSKEDYIFTGWYDGDGNKVTEILDISAGNLVLIASWRPVERACLTFCANAPCVRDMPEPICVKPGETAVIPGIIPRKKGHRFVEWNTQPLGSGVYYDPGDSILIPWSGMKLYALWMPVYCM